MKKPIYIAITGAAGQIGYSLIFRIASGEVFGHDQPIILNLIEIPSKINILHGLVMELNDSAYELLNKITITDKYAIGFKKINWALLIGSYPRTKNMNRNDLLSVNGKIFAYQGKALNEYASKNVHVLVVGNPCNTNCLIAMNNAPTIPRNQWFAMTRLDENRAKFQIAKKAKVAIKKITNLIIWGNHSKTQYPDFYNAKIFKKPVTTIILDHKWLKNNFIQKVQNRGDEIIKIKGKSSIASAANAIVDTIKSLLNKNKDNDFYSLGVYSNGNKYGFAENLIISLPVKTISYNNFKINYKVVDNLLINKFSQQKINISIQELIKERDSIMRYLV